MKPSRPAIRVGAVSYLNTVPLVWGMLRGPQQDQVELSFSIPSVCAAQLERGEIDLGLVPIAEVARQGLEIIPGVGITCLGAVRSILLFSRVPWQRVRTLAADLSSRTSVQLARIILRERFGVTPEITEEAPVIEEMLAHADAALVIGDPALRIEPETLPFEWLDLGEEWLKLTGLPMVFAAWAAKPGLPLDVMAEITLGSYAFGRDRLAEVVEGEYRARGVRKELAQEYLTRYIRFEMGEKEVAGLNRFLELSRNETGTSIGHRTPDQLFESDDLIGLGMEADRVRKQLHPEGLVSYSMEPGASTETVTFAAGAQLPEILQRLEEIRQRQSAGAELLAVMPRSNGTAVEHLKIVALTRIYLTSVPHVQASWQGGLKVGQVALRFGANDINGAEAGSLRATEEDIRRLIRDAGFTPKQRDQSFRTYFLS